MSDTLPLSIQNNRRMEKWIRFQPDRTVRLAVGKVELGQGNVTALAQIAADELDVNLDRISVLSGDTQDAPDEGQTTSSQSIEVSGRSVRLVSAELRARVLDRLAQRLNCSPTELSVEDGIFRRGDAPTGHDYWSFAAAEDFARDIDGSATPKPHTAYRYVGKATPRRDLPAKVAGAAFIHDMKRPDMLHARILRQPCRGARLASLDEAAIRRAERGDFRIVRVGNFVAFVGADETVVQRASAVASLHAKWDNVRQIAPAQQEAAGLVGQPCDDRVHGDPVAATTGTVVERELFAALCCACVDGTVVRAGGVSRRPSVGVVAHAGTVSSALGVGECAGRAAGHDHRAACAWCGVLWAQRGGRCRGGCCCHCDAASRSLHPRAMAPRGGVRVRAGWLGDARDAARRARRCWKTGGLDCGNMVGHARATTEQRRQHADARGVADAAAGSSANRSAGGERWGWHAQRDTAV